MQSRKQTVGATEFKAKCLAFLDEVDENGAILTITRRGRPVAVLGPVSRKAWKSPRDSCSSIGRITGDIVNVDTSGLWNVLRKK